MREGARIVKLSDGSSIEVSTERPFCPTEERHTGTVQSVLFVFNDEEFEPIAICDVYFKSFGKDFASLCDNGQLGLDEFVAKNLDGADAIRYAHSLLLSKDICQRAHSVEEVGSLIESHEFCGYWLFAHQFADGKHVESQMTLGTASLFSLIDLNDFASYTQSNRAAQYPDHWGMGTGRVFPSSDRLAV